MATLEWLGGLVAGNRAGLREILLCAGIDDSNPLLVAGMEDYPVSYSAVLNVEGPRDIDQNEREVVAVSTELAQSALDIGAILLVCSDLPSNAAAMHEAVRLPIVE